MRVMRVEIQLAGVVSAGQGIRDLARQLGALDAARQQVAGAVTVPLPPAASPTLTLPPSATRTLTLPPAGPGQGSGAQPGPSGGLQPAPVVMNFTTFVQAVNIQMQAAQVFALAVSKMPAGGRGAPPTRPPTPPPAIAGPNAQIAAIRRRYVQLRAQGGTAGQYEDLDIQMRAAEARLARARNQQQGPSRGQALTNAILSTRFNVGGQNFGVSPLVNRTLQVAGLTGGQAAGVAAGAMAIALVVAAATLALRTFVDVVKSTAAQLNETASAGTLSGGTTAQVTGLQTLGLPAGQIAALAAGLREQKGTNPFAMQQFGFQMPRPFGGANEAKGLQDAIETIANIDDAEKRLTAARLGQLDSILPLIEAMRRSRDAYNADKKAREGIDDPKSVQLAQDLAFATTRVSNNWEELLHALVKPVLPEITAAFQTLADVLREMGRVLNEHPDMIRDLLIKPLQGFFQFLRQLVIIPIIMAEATGAVKKGATKQAWESLGKIGDDFNANLDKLNSAVSANTDAHKKTTDALDGLGALVRGGTYGGGARAQSALPAHLIPSAVAAGQNWRTLHLGVWAL